MELPLTHKISVIGPRALVLQFRAAGWEVFFAADLKGAREIVLRLIEANYKLIFVADEYLPGISDIINKFSAIALPAIIGLGGRPGEAANSRQMLRARVKKAVGIDLERLGKQ